MKRVLLFALGGVLIMAPRMFTLRAAVPQRPFIIDHRRSPHTALRPLPYDAVQWTHGFWADRYRQLAQTTLDESWRLLADPAAGHVLDNFRAAAKPGTGRYAGTPWQDEWLYKWIEAAACVWRNTREPSLLRRMDEGIALIAAAQQPDGYLATRSVILGEKRFLDPRFHEFYNMGHLITAGVIHRRMTGDDRLFTVARRAADYACATLGVTVEPYFAHNPSIVMGLVELYRDTGDQKYLATAQLIVDRRGAKPKKQTLFTMQPGIGGTDVIQDRVPVRDSHEVVGHNVFFTYLYTGAGDVSAEAGDPALAAALQRLWSDVTERKMFIHGGVSAQPVGLSNSAPVVEAAGTAYDLPNAGCYNETCGQIGMLMWGYRMLAEHPDAQFADVMEREMYNGFLGAEGLDGKSWFYRNVIRRYDENYEATGGTDMSERGQPGRKAICCPSNLLRTIAELSAYFYGQDDAGVWIHHYGGNTVTMTLAGGGRFAFEQVTDYPWSGAIKVVIHDAPATPVSVRLRIPGWCEGATVAVNDAKQSVALARGYATLQRAWRAGDTIELSLPMPTRLMAADPRVEQTRNQAAVMRGPVLYCLESPDLPKGRSVASVFVPSRASFRPVPGLAGSALELAAGTVSLSGAGLYREDPMRAPLYRPLGEASFEPIELKLIPYFAWANRGRSAMSVWLPVVLQP